MNLIDITLLARLSHQTFHRSVAVPPRWAPHTKPRPHETVSLGLLHAVQRRVRNPGKGLGRVHAASAKIMSMRRLARLAVRTFSQSNYPSDPEAISFPPGYQRISNDQQTRLTQSIASRVSTRPRRQTRHNIPIYGPPYLSRYAHHIHFSTRSRHQARYILDNLILPSREVASVFLLSRVVESGLLAYPQPSEDAVVTPVYIQFVICTARNRTFVLSGPWHVLQARALWPSMSGNQNAGLAEALLFLSGAVTSEFAFVEVCLPNPGSEKAYEVIHASSREEDIENPSERMTTT
ncbi:hypothetical protein F5I97DRAFT_1827640 [Phlebopus sp. FC_14]|nr:hypothetical protein F5I97DRAFT_1827640 [Phlebopus sp. FC_14]